MGFIIHFYIIFGTNLLTGGPPKLLFFAYFSVSKEKGNKRSPNGMKPSGTWFSERTRSRRLGVEVKKRLRRPQGWRARPPLQGAPYLVGPSDGHWPTSSSYIYPRTPRKSREPTKNDFFFSDKIFKITHDFFLLISFFFQLIFSICSL